MPRKYVKKGILKLPDATNLFNAIKMVLIDKQAVRGAATACGIVNATLHRHLDKVKKHFSIIEGVKEDDLLAFVEGNLSFGGKTLFSASQEKDLVRYIISSAKKNNGLSINNIRSLAYNFAVKNGVKFPAGWAETKMATKDWYYAFMRRHQKSHVGRVLEKHHMSGLTDKDPLNASIFSDDDFLAANISGESRIAEDPPKVEDVPSLLVVLDKTDVESNKAVSASDGASICGLSYQASTSASASTSSAKPKSNHCRMATKSVILTSPQKRSELLETAKKSAESRKRSKSQKPTCEKAKKQSRCQEEEDRNFCLLCLELMPTKLNLSNSIHCNKCGRPYHLKCVDMGNRGYYTCRNCDSDLDE